MVRGMPPDLLDLGSSLGYLDELAEAYRDRPDAVDPSWHDLLGDGKPRGGNGNGSSNVAGVECMPIWSPAGRSWPAERMERQLLRPLPVDVRKRMLQLLVNSEQFERFCHRKYPGTKRFSLEGSESLIPLLDLVLTHTAAHG